MPAKIRLSRHGRRKKPFYHIVIADARAPRDGKFIQKIGVYNPMTKPATIDLDRDAAFDWIMKGAQPTDTVRAILKFKGVFFKKHLQRGVSKGSLTQEEADVKYQAWIDDKEAKVAARREVESALILERRRAIAEGAPKARAAASTDALVAFAATEVGDAAEAVVEEVATEAAEVVTEAAAVVEEAAAVVEEVVAAPVEEVVAKTEEVVEEAEKPSSEEK